MTDFYNSDEIMIAPEYDVMLFYFSEPEHLTSLRSSILISSLFISASALATFPDFLLLPSIRLVLDYPQKPKLLLL